MDTPKPKPPVKKTDPQQTQQDKKPFKLKPHLTVRPFSDEALFAKLRDQARPDTMKTEAELKKEVSK